MIGFVYKWVNIETCKYYIGSHGGNPEDGYISSSRIFNHAIKKHGIDKYRREILYFGENYRTEEERLLKECNAADDIKSYNIKNEAFGATLLGPKNGMFGKTHTDESKQKIGEKSWMKTEEGRIKVREMNIGEGNPMFGKRKSEFTINKQKETVKRKNEEWGFLHGEKHHRNLLLKIYRVLNKYGKESAPRGLKVKEIENFSYIFPPYVRFTNFEPRKLNINYIKKEFLWYLKGDKFDISICEYAKMWKEFINEDGSINSNYGQYIFGQENQFDYVLKALIKDKDSRRAAIIILQPYHTRNEKMKEIPCTYNISFRIRNNKLNMTVKMRSQDSILGLGSDLPTFSFIHEMMFISLKYTYPELEYGEYYHFVDSFHIYERHYEMLKALINRRTTYAMVYCPKISSKAEVDYLRAGNFDTVPENYKFTIWLLDNEDKK